jgi:hypothetical protein
MTIENNTMGLGEYQEWAEKGKPLDDAAQGLIFKALELAKETEGGDVAIPIYLQIAQVAATLHLADEIAHFSITVKELDIKRKIL